MEKYTNINDCPTLTATAVALKINGITNASTDAQKLTAVNSMRAQVQGLAPAQANDFLKNITEKVLKQEVILSVLWKSPLTSLFINKGSSPSKLAEIVEGKPVAPGDYDKNQRILSKDNVVDKVVQIIRNNIWKVTNITVYNERGQIRSAFISEQSYSNWITGQIKEMAQGLEIYLHDLFIRYIKDSIKNNISFKGSKLDDTFIKLVTLANDMTTELTDEYALGFNKADIDANKNVELDPTTGDWVITTNKTELKVQDIIKKEVIDYSDMVLITSNSFKTDLTSKVGAIKFHNEFFNTNKFGKVITLKDKHLIDVTNKTQTAFLIDKKAFYGWLIMTAGGTMFWPTALKSDITSHWRGSFGLIRWKMGVKIELDSSFDTNPTTYTDEAID